MLVTSLVCQIKSALDAERRDVQAFDLDHAFDAFQSVDHALQVLQIVDVHGQVDPPRTVVQNLVIGARVADVGFDIGDGVGQRRKLSCAVFGHHRELHRVRVFDLVGHPGDFDDPLAVDHQVRGVLASRGVNAHALAARDVSYDLFTADRAATGRAIDQHVVNALDQNAVVAQAQRAFDGL